ncbi:hypothetical protein CPB85DRAFT_1504998 [Mucidula mucida]|nr:hypothetical protein CPB85DRAFT_1504998 [Mucidula mucida]
MSSLLSLPPEVRLIIYDCFLAAHTDISGHQQPSNTHFRLLHTCTQIAREAACLRSYISLPHELQILSFLSSASPALLQHIRAVDVANDGRVLPVSHVFEALRRMPIIQSIRVFECTRGVPQRDLGEVAPNLSLQFECAIFPYGPPPSLMSYELYLDPSTTNTIFQSIPPENIHALRLSGRCRFSQSVRLPNLTDLTICSVTSNYLDQHLEESISSSRLHDFRYSQGHRMGFQITGRHLSFITQRSSATLRQLVLLECSKLSSRELASCLECLSALEYFALSFITVNELDSNFVLSIPCAVKTVKLSVTNARFTSPFIQQEEALCDVLENRYLSRSPPPDCINAMFREEVLKSRVSRWRRLAQSFKYNLYIGPWELKENM